MQDEIIEIYALTPEGVLSKKLALLDLKEGETMYDFGSGDGQCLIRASQQYQTKGVGYELLPNAIELSRKNIQKAGLADKIEIRNEDFMNIHVGEMTAVFLYLNRKVLGLLSLQLETELPKGARIVTHDFDLPAWEAEEEVDFMGSDGVITKIYLYRKG